jgi:hypothetical protein
VLILLVHFLNDLEAAEKYCIELHNEDEENNAFVHLINICFINEERKCEVWHHKNQYFEEQNLNSFAINILEKHGNKMNLEDFLRVIPDNFKIEHLYFFLSKCLIVNSFESVSLKLYKEYMKLEEERNLIIEEYSCGNVVYSGTECHSCHKTIGQGIPVVLNFPNFVFHAKCFKRK